MHIASLTEFVLKTLEFPEFTWQLWKEITVNWTDLPFATFINFFSLSLTTQPVLDLLGYFNLCRSLHWPTFILHHCISRAERAPVASPPLLWIYHIVVFFFFMSLAYTDVFYVRWLLPCRFYREINTFLMWTLLWKLLHKSPCFYTEGRTAQSLPHIAL